MKRYYEIVIIFAPNISEEKLQSFIRKIKGIITETCSGVIINEENWGNKKLAYEIKKFENGIYYFIACETEKNTLPSELKKFFSTNEEIIRYGIKKIEKLNKKEVSKETITQQQLV